MFRFGAFGLSLIIVLGIAHAARECIPRSYYYSSTVCVCNSTYCDDIEKITPLPRGYFVAFTTTMDGKRFDKHHGMMKPMSRLADTSYPWFIGNPSLKINRKKRYQKVYGFGVSFTDSSGINLAKLSPGTRANLIRSYFGETGIECNMGRVPIGGTDFSTHPYAYDVVLENDIKLSNFSLAMEDFEYKIPFIKEAMNVATSKMYLIASNWSPPKWMKVNDNWWGVSRLFTSYYQTFVDYHIRFFEEYEKVGISFWGVTTGNEPSIGLGTWKINGLGWMPGEQAKWIAEYFGPTIRKSKFKDLKIIAYDDMRHLLQIWMADMKNYAPEFEKYIDGIAVHWYTDDAISPNALDETQEMFPNKFLMMTEAATTAMIDFTYKILRIGSWDRVLYYMHFIIQNFQHSMTGWIEWNLALDMNGGPSWTDNFIEAPIMVDGDKDEFIKLPIFYALGHFSKFVTRGSVRVDVETLKGEIEHVAFLRPDGGLVIVLHNPEIWEKIVTVQEKGKGYLELNVPGFSIQTVVYW